MNKVLEAIKEAEKMVKNKERVSEEKIEKRFLEFEDKINVIFKLLEEKDKKIEDSRLEAMEQLRKGSRERERMR